jgi:hypothetical protein
MPNSRASSSAFLRRRRGGAIRCLLWSERFLAAAICAALSREGNTLALAYQRLFEFGLMPCIALGRVPVRTDRRQHQGRGGNAQGYGELSVCLGYHRQPRGSGGPPSTDISRRIASCNSGSRLRRSRPALPLYEPLSKETLFEPPAGRRPGCGALVLTLSIKQPRTRTSHVRLNLIQTDGNWSSKRRLRDSPNRNRRSRFVLPEWRR